MKNKLLDLTHHTEEVENLRAMYEREGYKVGVFCRLVCGMLMFEIKDIGELYGKQ